MAEVDTDKAGMAQCPHCLDWHPVRVVEITDSTLVVVDTTGRPVRGFAGPARVLALHRCPALLPEVEVG